MSAAMDPTATASEEPEPGAETREKLRKLLRQGAFDDREIDIEVDENAGRQGYHAIGHKALDGKFRAVDKALRAKLDVASDGNKVACRRRRAGSEQLGSGQ